MCTLSSGSWAFVGFSSSIIEHSSDFVYMGLVNEWMYLFSEVKKYILNICLESSCDNFYSYVTDFV